jgi:Iron-containing redox enzyme
MTNESLEWTGEAPKLGGPGFNRFQIQLTKYNAWRLRPQLSGPAWREELARESKVVLAEAKFVEAVRKEVAPLLNEVPQEVDHFIRWFEELRESGPGQGDPLFPWLATEATHEQMLWFLTQEVAGEAGFDDLLALTQVQMPELAKLEMARNYWDEMGRGTSKGMHGPMLHRLAKFLEIDPHPEAIVPEALALGNMMISLARNRRYAYQSVGALGVIEMTAPTRASYVDAVLSVSECLPRSDTTLRYTQCSISSTPNVGIARSCARSSTKTPAALMRSARVRSYDYGTVLAALSAIAVSSA